MLSSCSEKVRDVQYYIDHPDERVAMFKKCKYDPNQNRENPECKNVFKAHVMMMNKSSEIQHI